MLNLQNIQDAKRKLLNSNPYDFTGNIQNGFVDYLRKIEVDEFRHIKNLEIEFKHPVTVISGTNAIGKTSILLLIA